VGTLLAGYNFCYKSTQYGILKLSEYVELTCDLRGTLAGVSWEKKDALKRLTSLVLYDRKGPETADMVFE